MSTADPNDPTSTLKAVCPNCGSPRAADEVFCEVCGLDFATGKLPTAPPAPTAAAAAGAKGAATGWLVVVEVDGDFFKSNESDESLSPPTGTVPQEIPLRSDEILIGRTSASANVHPDIDLSTDVGVSRRHASMRKSGDGWTITDLGSTNGTRLRGTLLEPNDEQPLAEGDVVHVGAWTRLTLQRAAGSSS